MLPGTLVRLTFSGDVTTSCWVPNPRPKNDGWIVSSLWGFENKTSNGQCYITYVFIFAFAKKNGEDSLSSMRGKPHCGIFQGYHCAHSNFFVWKKEWKIVLSKSWGIFGDPCFSAACPHSTAEDAAALRAKEEELATLRRSGPKLPAGSFPPSPINVR